jgi:hypothetical protein
MSKQYRKSIGFTNKDKCFAFLKAKDIVSINWNRLELYNQRLIEIGLRIQKQLIVPNDMSVQDFILDSFHIMKDNQIIETLNNHGRSNENVYYSWMIGYLAETLFTPLIKKELKLNTIIRTGGDNLTNPETFKRISNADLSDPTQNIVVDVQCGIGESKCTIKKSKVDFVINNGYNGYAFVIGLGTGLYGVINLNELKNVEFVKNFDWEGAPCWTAPDNIFKSWSK